MVKKHVQSKLDDFAKYIQVTPGPDESRETAQLRFASAVTFIILNERKMLDLTHAEHAAICHALLLQPDGQIGSFTDFLIAKEAHFGYYKIEQ